MDAKVLLIVALFALTEADFGSLSSSTPQRSLRDIESKRIQLNYLKGLVQGLDDTFEKLEKRTCTITFPGSDCGEVKGTGKDNSHWNSANAPGKKRRQSLLVSRRGSASTPSRSEQREASQQDEDLTLFNI